MQGRLSSALYSRPANRSSVTRRTCDLPHWERNRAASRRATSRRGRGRVASRARSWPGGIAEVARNAWAEFDGRSCPGRGMPCTRGLLWPVPASLEPHGDPTSVGEGRRPHDPRSVTSSRCPNQAKVRPYESRGGYFAARPGETATSAPPGSTLLRARSAAPSRRPSRSPSRRPSLNRPRGSRSEKVASRPGRTIR